MNGLKVRHFSAEIHRRGLEGQICNAGTGMAYFDVQVDGGGFEFISQGRERRWSAFPGRFGKRRRWESSRSPSRRRRRS